MSNRTRTVVHLSPVAGKQGFDFSPTEKRQLGRRLGQLLLATESELSIHFSDETLQQSSGLPSEQDVGQQWRPELIDFSTGHRPFNQLEAYQKVCPWLLSAIFEAHPKLLWYFQSRLHPDISNGGEVMDQWWISTLTFKWPGSLAERASEVVTTIRPVASPPEREL